MLHVSWKTAPRCGRLGCGRAAFIALAASLPLSAGGAVAAPTTEPAEPSPALEQITILATRTPTAVDLAPAPVEIIDQARIDQRQSGVPADLLRGAPGFMVSQSGGVGSVTEVRLRGAEANHLKVLVDGVDINDPALNSSVDFANLDLIGATRIEVLPGAQSALWGSDALAGVMNFDTTPAVGADARVLWLEGGSNDTSRESIAISRRTDASYYAINARHTQTAGTNIATSGGEDDGYRNTTLHVNTGYTGERASVTLVGRIVDAQSEYDPTPGPNFVPVDGNLELDVRQRLFGLTGRYAATANWDHQVSFKHYDSNNENQTDGVRDSSSDGAKNRATYQSDYSFAWGAIANLLTFAAEYTREDFNQRGVPGPFGDPNQDQHMDTRSVVAEWVADAFGATAALSGRHDDNSDFDDANDWRAAVRVPLVRDTTVLFVDYGTGTKDPTFVERFGFTPDTFIGNPNLRPERSRSASIAVAHTFDAAVSSRIALFRDRLDDEIDGFVFDPFVGGFTARNTNGESRREGVELTLTAQLGPSVRVRADYTYLDATQPGTAHQEDELRRPHDTGRVLIDYAALPGRLEFEFGAAFVGGQFDNDFATFPARRVRLDGYTLIHCTARWRLDDRFELTGRIENAADEHYQDVFGYATPGRRAYVGIQARL